MSTKTPIMLEGNLTQDPTVHESNGVTYARFLFAVNPRVPDGEGGFSDGEPEFHQVTAFGGLGENTAAQLRRGDRAVIAGQLQFRSWTDAETGKRRQGIEIVAEHIGASTRFRDTILVNRSPREPSPEPDRTGPVAEATMEPSEGGIRRR